MTEAKIGVAESHSCAVCGIPAVRYQGRHLCAKHYRLGQMRVGAKRRGKSVPTREELDALVPVDMKCPDCGIQMQWLGVEGMVTAATLQHYRDGTFGIVCCSCNSRHTFMPGDTYRDMPKDHKNCPECKTIKPITDFPIDNSRGGRMNVRGLCKPCASVKSNAWKKVNREKYNASMRAYKAKRKAEGNPVRSRPPKESAK